MALVTMFCWGVSNGFMKIPSIRLGPAKAIRMRQFVMLMMLASYVFFLGKTQYHNSIWLIWTICLGLFGYLPFLFFCQALRIGSVGSVNAVGNSFPVVTVIINFIFLNVFISKLMLVGMLVTGAGICLLSFSRKNQAGSFQSRETIRALMLALLACVLWGGFYAAIPFFNNHLDPIPLTMCLQFGTFISAHIHSTFQSKRRNIPKRCLIFSIFAGIFAVIGSLFFYTALHYGNSGVLTAIAGSSPIVGAIFGRIVYGEKGSSQETLGILVTVAGVIILSLTR